MRIAVYGAGGVGGYFGGKLAQNKTNEVIFIARGKHLQAMKTDGLHVESLQGDFIIQPVSATDDPPAVGKVDLVLVCIKAWQVPEIAESIIPMLESTTIVLPLQNGIEAPDQLSSVLGAGHVLAGSCKIFSYIDKPGYIHHVGVEPAIAFGELDNNQSDRLNILHQTLTSSGIKSIIPPDIHATLWKKFLYICSTSGPGALTRAPIGILRKIPETRQIIEQSMNEIFAIAQKKNINLESDLIAKSMLTVDAMPPDVIPSLQRDIVSGRPSELNEQNGAVVRLGKETGIDTPVNTIIYSSLLPMELNARGKI